REDEELPAQEDPQRHAEERQAGRVPLHEMFQHRAGIRAPRGPAAPPAPTRDPAAAQLARFRFLHGGSSLKTTPMIRGREGRYGLETAARRHGPPGRGSEGGMKIQVGELFACPDACPLQLLRSRTSP